MRMDQAVRVVTFVTRIIDASETQITNGTKAINRLISMLLISLQILGRGLSASNVQRLQTNPHE